jgi:alkanesulfonate monooxygenase SsuD/methylene tetrahydromethanopterin reductase-like flavin-dependent oxidoreductase (luciferase family)
VSAEEASSVGSEKIVRGTASTEFGICAMPRSIRQTIRLAAVSEKLGFAAFGVGDGHFLHHDLYAVITAALLNTNSIKVAPCTSNTVARNWSVHASTARALDELCPGRFVLGLATGDGSVRSVGLTPKRWTELQADVENIRARSPQALEIQCTASGLRGAHSAGIWADSLAVGTGADPVAIANLASAAEEGRRRSTLAKPIAVWAMIPVIIVDSEAELPGAREAMRMGAYASAHFAFGSSYEGKNVPPEYETVIRERLSLYDYRYHGVVTDENPNLRLLDDRPEVADYLIDRMSLIGTMPQVSQRIAKLVAEAPLAGLWLCAQEEETVHRLATAVR